jgi:hypothetical protein
MEQERLEQIVSEHFDEEVDDNRNIYFQTYYSHKPIDNIDFVEFFSDQLEVEDVTHVESNGDTVVVEIGGHRLVVLSLPYDNWLVLYSSALSDSNRYSLRRLSNNIGWLMDAWVPGETVEDLYQKYADEQDKVRIKRRWDPYYLYQNYSKVPAELQEYFEEHLDQFEEQETEFSLKTPRRMVDDVLDTRLTEDFIERSEVAESRFDVHLSNPGDAAVTVGQGGSVIHRSGEPHATAKVVNEIQQENERLHQEFREIIPTREYEETSGGMVGLSHYEPPKVLKLTFPQQPYNEEASIKLSNLLTVGQSDAELHGYVSSRDELEFRCRTYITFDQSEYEISFRANRHHPTLYIRPVDATVDGVIYLYHTLKRKFDTQIDHEILEEEELAQVVQ